MPEYQNLFNIVRYVIKDFLDPSILVNRNEYKQYFKSSPSPALCTVYVHLWVDGKLRASGSSYEKPIEEAVQNATVNALEVPLNGEFLLLSEIKELTPQLFIKIAKEKIQPPYEGNITKALKYYEKGLMLSVHGDIFELLPSTMVLKKLRSPMDKIGYLSELANLENDEIDKPYVELFSVKWLNLVETTYGIKQFIRGRSDVKPTVNPEHIRKAANNCTKRLVNQQVINGAYSYEYNALSDTIDHGDKVNMVRMAGTAFSVAMMAAKTIDITLENKFHTSAQLAFKYLFSYAHSTKSIDDGIFIAQNNEYPYGKLGATALALLGLQFGSFYKSHQSERQGFINTILGLQEEDGSFNCYIQLNKKRRSTQNYFPGEALLALCYELKNQKNAAITTCILNSFNYYRQHFRNYPHTAFVLWQVSAWALFYKILESDSDIQRASKAHSISKADIAEFVYEQTDWILNLQHTEQTTRISEFIGGFPRTGIPHSVSSCYIESVIRAAQLAYNRENSEKYIKYKKASLLGLEFLLRLQLKEEEAFIFPNPEFATGGISGTLVSFQLRGDRDQHAITAFLAALESPCLFETSPQLINLEG